MYSTDGSAATGISFNPVYPRYQVYIGAGLTLDIIVGGAGNIAHDPQPAVESALASLGASLTSAFSTTGTVASFDGNTQTNIWAWSTTGFILSSWSQYTQLIPGSSYDINIWLSNAPASSTTFTVELDGSGTGFSLSPATLTFTTTNWATPQAATLTVSGSANIGSSKSVLVYNNSSPYQAWGTALYVSGQGVSD